MSNRIQTTIIIHRFETQTPFPAVTAEFVSHQQTAYLDTNKVTSKDTQLSTDKLNKTTVTVFASTEAFEEYVKDPAVLSVLNTRNEYCQANGMRITILKQELAEDGSIASSNFTTLFGA